MDQEIEISKLSPDNVNDAFLIEKSSFSQPFGLDDLLHYARGGYSLVAKYGGKVVGYILGETAADECQIMKVATREGLRRRGIAKRLVSELTKMCRGSGARKIFLEVRASNKAAADLYRGAGFAELYVRKGYYSDPVEDAIVMQRTL